MLYFDWIDVPKGTDVNKARASKDFDIFHYWYLLNYFDNRVLILIIAVLLV